MPTAGKSILKKRNGGPPVALEEEDPASESEEVPLLPVEGDRERDRDSNRGGLSTSKITKKKLLPSLKNKTASPQTFEEPSRQSYTSDYPLPRDKEYQRITVRAPPRAWEDEVPPWAHPGDWGHQAEAPAPAPVAAPTPTPKARTSSSEDKRSRRQSLGADENVQSVLTYYTNLFEQALKDQDLKTLFMVLKDTQDWQPPFKFKLQATQTALTKLSQELVQKRQYQQLPMLKMVLRTLNALNSSVTITISLTETLFNATPAGIFSDFSQWRNTNGEVLVHLTMTPTLVKKLWSQQPQLVTQMLETNMINVGSVTSTMSRKRETAFVLSICRYRNYSPEQRYNFLQTLFSSGDVNIQHLPYFIRLCLDKDIGEMLPPLLQRFQEHNPESKAHIGYLLARYILDNRPLSEAAFQQLLARSSPNYLFVPQMVHLGNSCDYPSGTELDKSIKETIHVAEKNIWGFPTKGKQCTEHMVCGKAPNSLTVLPLWWLVYYNPKYSAWTSHLLRHPDFDVNYYGNNDPAILILQQFRDKTHLNVLMDRSDTAVSIKNNTLLTTALNDGDKSLVAKIVKHGNFVWTPQSMALKSSIDASTLTAVAAPPTIDKLLDLEQDFQALFGAPATVMEAPQPSLAAPQTAERHLAPALLTPVTTALPQITANPQLWNQFPVKASVAEPSSVLCPPGSLYPLLDGPQKAMMPAQRTEMLNWQTLAATAVASYQPPQPVAAPPAAVMTPVAMPMAMPMPPTPMISQAPIAQPIPVMARPQTNSALSLTNPLTNLVFPAIPLHFPPVPTTTLPLQAPMMAREYRVMEEA